MGSKTDTHENAVLNIMRGSTYTAPAAVYSALYTTAPSDSTAGTEVTNASSGYTRAITTFVTAGATTDGSMVNLTAIVWATFAASVTVIGWGLLSTSTVGAGTLYYYTTVTTVAYVSGDQPTIAALTGITITED